MVEGEIDFTAHTEPELVEMFGRMDPRYAPQRCARLGKLLTERGYIVTNGELGPGYAVPSPAKLQALIGSSQPIDFNVDFGEGGYNDLGFFGSGMLSLDGISAWVSGRSVTQPLVPSLFKQVRVPYPKIVNVESRGRLVRFEYRAEDISAITLRLDDKSAAERLVAVLPKVRTGDFQPHIPLDEEFAQRLIAQLPETPATFAMIAINALVFIATLLAGADWLKPTAAVEVTWGANFAPYTTDGEWWRLFTSLFIHFGLLHLASNMIALAIIGPLVERLYGSANYAFIYLLAGVSGSAATIAWHPDVASAGASGAIFGILGALLAALFVGQLHRGNTFPRDLRRIGIWALLFLLWSVYAGFTVKGIAHAAHIGGLATGFLLGLTATHAVTERSHIRRDLRSLLRTVPVAVAVLSGGIWWAQTAATTLSGDGLYLHTAHWFLAGKHSADSRFKEALALTRAGRQNERALADRVERDVLPFWRQASARLSTITLSSSSPYLSALELLRDVSDGRVRAYELLSKGLQENDIQEIAAAERELKRVDEIAKEPRAAR